MAVRYPAGSVLLSQRGGSSALRSQPMEAVPAALAVLADASPLLDGSELRLAILAALPDDDLLACLSGGRILNNFASS